MIPAVPFRNNRAPTYIESAPGMNPYVVWMPSVAAAALLGTAAYLAATDEQPAEVPTARVFEDEDAAEPVIDSLDPEAEQAAKDEDGGDMLDIMEKQLLMARRVASAMRNAQPTKADKYKLFSFHRKAGLELKKLKEMGQTVPQETFSRAEQIVQELLQLRDEGEAAYQAFRKERKESIVGRRPENQAPPAPENQAPPAPEIQAPPAPEFRAPPAPEFQAPPAPEFRAPPAPEFRAPPAPEFRAPPAPEIQAPPPAPVELM
jgi:hypothetical protein